MRHQSIFIIYYDLGIGGVQRKIIDIVNQAHINPSLRGSAIHILLEDRQKTTLVSELHNPHVHIHYKPFFRLPLWVYIFYCSLLYKPTSVLTFLPLSSVAAIIASKFLFWRKINIVISEDVITSHAFRRGDFTESINRRIPYYFSKADRILAPSQAIIKDLLKNYDIPKRLITFAPNWSTVTPRKNLEKPIDCVYAGRLDKEKNIPTMLSIISFVKSEIPFVSFWIVGEGKEKKRIQKMVAQLHLNQNVHLIEPHASIRFVMSKAKIAVLASKSEGVPMFLLEAMAHGVPVVSWRFPGVDDIIENTSSGYICGSQSEFALCIIRLLRNKGLRDRMGKMARERALSKYSQKNIDTYMELLF